MKPDTDSIFYINYQYFSSNVVIPKDLKRQKGEPIDEFMVSVNAQSVDDTLICIELNSQYRDTEPISIEMEDKDMIAFAKAILHIAALRQEYNRTMQKQERERKQHNA